MSDYLETVEGWVRWFCGRLLMAVLYTNAICVHLRTDAVLLDSIVKETPRCEMGRVKNVPLGDMRVDSVGMGREFIPGVSLQQR